MIKAIAILLFLPGSLVSPTQAGDKSFRPHEKEAAGIIQQAVDSIKALESLQMRFNYILLNPDNKVELKVKSELITQADKYYMHVGEHYFISNGEVAWAYFSDVNEVHVSSADDMDHSLSPMSILESFTRDVRPVWVRKEPVQGRAADIIDLFPHEAQMFYKYRIALFENCRSLAYIQAHNRNGDILLYETYEYLPNVTVDPNLFTFSPEDHPGIEVVDLR